LVTIISLLQVGFMIWMLVDAARTRPPVYWYLIAFVPFGPLVYFLAFKSDEPLAWLKRLVNPARPPSLADLRDELRRSPSYQNRLRLANALYDAGHFDDAAKSFEIIVETRGDDPDALYGLGRCRLSLGEPAAAIEPLSRLIAQNRTYRDYAACLDLAEAYAKAGDEDDALDLLHGLVRQSPRATHRVALAQQQIAMSLIEEAQKTLREAIAEERGAPDHIQRRERDAVKEAERLLREISPRR
jgi:hypothetical protein